jgi:hypothetical protein
MTSGEKLAAALLALFGAGWVLLRSKSAAASMPASEDSGASSAAPSGPCKPWSGDGKAMQNAINAALAKAEGPGKPKAVTPDGKPGAMTCRAAEWLRDTKQATPEILAFVASEACGCGMKRAPCGIGGPVAPQSVKDAIVAAGVAKGYTASDVTKAISRESGWHAQALNCQGADKHPVAGGLNQMLGSVLKANGFKGSPDQFAGLTAEQQLPFVLSFIKKMPPSTLHLPGDFGLALFTPAYVGKPDSFVIYDVGSSGWQQNPGLRTPGNGPITAGSVRKTAA